MIASLGLAACDVDQTREAKAPAVDVEAGQLPRYDVEGPEGAGRKSMSTVSMVIVTVAETVAAGAASELFVSRHASRHEDGG